MPALSGRYPKPSPGLRVDLAHRLAPSTAVLVNEGAGLILNDAALGMASSAFVGGPTWVTGEVGPAAPALHFTAASSQSVTFATVPRKPLAQREPQATIAALFRTTNAGTTALSVGGEGSTASYRIELTANATVAGRLTFTTVTVGGTTVSLLADVAVNDGFWHLCHGVNVGNNLGQYLYMNGALVASNATQGIATQAPASLQVRVGARPSGAAATFFDGDISFLMLWSRALAAAEVAEHCQAPFDAILLPRLILPGYIQPFPPPPFAPPCRTLLTM